MEKLRLPLMLDAVYSFLLGIAMLNPSIAAGVFGHEAKDPGLVITLSGIFIGLGVLVWVIAGDVEKYGGLAGALVFVLLISAVFLVWAWMANHYTARTALVPLIINIVLAFWIWSAKPKT